MDYIKVVLVSLFSLLVLFVLAKIMGNKQVSQLTMFDYVIGISIGSIAAEMATELEEPFKPLLAMVVYALSAYLISIVTMKSMKLRRIIFGRSVVLMKNGKIYRNNLKKSHIDLNEFLVQCRSDGYFDISAINTAILEPNGKISILPFPDKRPVTAEDLKTVPTQDNIFYDVIMDGEIMKENLQSSSYDENWLKNELKTQGYKNEKNIFLATLDESGTLNVFENNNKSGNNDIFE
ncbi:MAG: DUF421 domain-containing protein [Clostridia bacterium]|nr:DUF421 domain-containing protein [Clostridia bacterium]